MMDPELVGRRVSIESYLGLGAERACSPNVASREHLQAVVTN